VEAFSKRAAEPEQLRLRATAANEDEHSEQTDDGESEIAGLGNRRDRGPTNVFDLRDGEQAVVNAHIVHIAVEALSITSQVSDFLTRQEFSQVLKARRETFSLGGSQTSEVVPIIPCAHFWNPPHQTTTR
jgi:hypothetical protein